MFRILGILVVVLCVATICMIGAWRKWVAPRLQKRRMDRLMIESRELDQQLDELGAYRPERRTRGRR